VQPILDLAVPRKRQGRVAMVGDAAFVPRHTRRRARRKRSPTPARWAQRRHVTSWTLMPHCENGSRCNSIWGASCCSRARRLGTVLNLASEPDPRSNPYESISHRNLFRPDSALVLHLTGLPTKRDAYIIPFSVVGIPKTIDNENGTDPRIAKARGQSSDSGPKKSGEKSS